MEKILRKIIKIDEDLCNGCGECIPGCPEQAIQLVDTPQGKKARLVKEFYCDGLGACLGHCPIGAIAIEEREAELYDEEATIARIKEVAPEMLKVHIKHLKEHSNELSKHNTNNLDQSPCGCPSAQTLEWEKKDKIPEEVVRIPSELRHWPIQLHLVNPSAPYFQNTDLIIVADCVPFSYANFHQEFLKDKSIAIGCPKLDDVDAYIEKISQIIKIGHPKRIKVIIMEVPCCSGLVSIVREAMKKAGVEVPVKKVVISIKGEILGKD